MTALNRNLACGFEISSWRQTYPCCSQGNALVNFLHLRVNPHRLITASWLQWNHVLTLNPINHTGRNLYIYIQYESIFSNVNRSLLALHWSGFENLNAEPKENEVSSYTSSKALESYPDGRFGNVLPCC
jgi:hypothetical protein